MVMNSRYSREMLIDEVKKYPVLYDTKHEHHKDIDVRDRCWHDISERIGANSESLKREWKILRDSLRQALKRTSEGATTRLGEPCKKWRFQNRMAFILPYVTFRGRRAVNPLVKLDEETEEPSDQEQNRDSEAWEPGPGGGGGGCGAGGGGSGGGEGDGDALDLFFASVCQSTKRLPRRQQAAVKRQVLDALLRAEEDADAEDAKPFTDHS